MPERPSAGPRSSTVAAPSGVVRQVFRLTTPWPTIDPFLFCVHHLDAYPAGTETLAPAASLRGRQLGSDFAGVDGWNMYHGATVPGFPAHPHRGFETVTYVRRGIVDHSDSLGAAARFGRGDAQWLTAGGGIVHAEMFPLLDREQGNTLELFQLWLNLPAADKLVPPHFSMLWGEQLPTVVSTDGGATVTVIAGALDGAEPPAPPPHSWAARADTDVAIWHVTLGAGATWTMPAARHPDTQRVVYAFAGSSVLLDGTSIEAGSGAHVACDAPTELRGGPTGPVECLVLQGRPIGEPVAQYGPFVLNDRAGIEQAFRDYERTRFGGWPWPADDPNHGPDRGRFARHADGRVEEPPGGSA